jgi:2-polyprenyl-3-methyl-5-hydroxy-6-metoxy-1,4-benzoquinol methylase
MFYGREKAWGEPDWRRRVGYWLLGELHIPGRLRSWHIIRALRRLGLWDETPRALYDAGGGEGAFAFYVARRFPRWHVVIADNEARTIDRALRIKRALGLQNLEVRDIDLREPGDEGRYDVVVCADVLEHIEQDDTVVKHLGHALKPGGALLVTSPSVPQPRHLPLVAWRERRIGFEPSDYGHVRQGYSEAQLTALFENAGLQVQAVRRTFGPAGTLMFDLFFSAGDSRPHPLVYAALFPLYMGLATADLLSPAGGGAAIFGIARKTCAVPSGAPVPGPTIDARQLRAVPLGVDGTLSH